MRRLRVVVCCLLGSALVAGFVALGDSSGSPWRDKASESVLRWVDAGGPGERVVLLGLAEGAVQRTQAATYVEAAHGTWLGSSMQPVAGAVGGIAPWAEAGLLLRAGSEIWESGLPYIHELGALRVRCTAMQARQLAQLGVVARLADGGDLVPTQSSQNTDRGAAPDGAGSPHELLTLGRLTAGGLERAAVAYSWDIIRLADVVRWEGEPRLTLRPATLEEWPTDSYSIVGLALDASKPNGASPEDCLQSGWAEHGVGSLTAGSLAWLTDALRQTGGDTAVVAVVGTPAGDALVFVLLRSETAVSLASLAGTDEIAQVGGPLLPRGQAPASVAATHGTHADRVFLSWEAVSGAGQYEVLRSTAAGGAFEPIGISGPGGFDDMDVRTCVSYAYRVRSLGDAGVGLESSASTGFIGLVPRPTERIWTSANGPGQILVEWAPVGGATEYRLMRTEPMSDKPKVSAQQYMVYEGAEPRFLDTDVIAGQKHLYRVFCLNGCGSSELSPQADGMSMYDVPLDPGRLNPPGWVEATRGRPYDKVQVTWRAVPGASAYRVLRAPSYAGVYESVVELSATSWDDRDVELCGDYWYRIQSISGANLSEPSATVYGSYGYRPSAPENLHASAGTYASIIEVTWSPMEDAISYQVSRAPSREGPFAVIARGVPTTSYVDEGLVPGQEFWYKVQALNPCGCSGDLGPAYGATSRT